MVTRGCASHSRMGNIQTGREATGERIRKRRERLGLTVHAFERMHGFSTGRIKRIEEGGGMLSEMAVQISEALGMPLNYLQTGRGPSAF